MHPRRHHTVYPFLAAATLSIAGCHATGPLQRSVQVSNRPTDDLAEVDAPPQRLTTSQPRGIGPAVFPVEADGHDRRPPREPGPTTGFASAGASQTRITDAFPGQARDASPGRVTDGRVTDGRVTDGRVTASLATLGMTPSRRSERGRVVSGPVVSGRVVSDSPPRPELTSAMLPAVEQKELIDAFSSSPPEVQELALRQLIAMASRTAERTEQPGNIAAALARAVSGGGGTPEPGSANVAQAVGSPDAANGSPAVAVTPVSDTRDVSDTDTQVVAAGGGSSTAERSGAAKAETEVKENPVADGKAREEGKVGSLDDFRDGENAVAKGKPDNEEGDASLADVRDEEAAEPKRLSDRELFEMLTSRLLRPGEEAGEAERSRREIMARHLMVLAGKPDAAVSEIDGLSEEEQEYVRHQLLALWTIIDPGGHPVTGRRFSTALPQLREATKYLAASTDTLDVRSLAFCTEIEAYGQIKEFPRSRFKPGQQVILYCEIENFTSQRSGDGFETHLEGSYSVYNEDDEKVFSQVLPADKQVSRNYLRDYFIAYQMYLPKQLSDGRYRLDLTMEDVEGKKYGQASVPFEIRE